MSASLERMIFTVERYHEMIDKGILTEDDRVELLEGELITMSPIGDRHNFVVKELLKQIARLSGDFDFQAQGPLILSSTSEPEPDIMILRPRSDNYRRKPRAEDVLLLIEVADATLERDRKLKLPLYARAGIPEVWIVDLQNDYVEVCREPDSETRLYKFQQTHGADAKIGAAFTNVTVSFKDLLT